MFDFKMDNPYNIIDFKASEMYAWVNVSAFLPLTCLICYYYFCMRSTLNECASVVLNDSSKEMKKFFAFLLFGFVFKVLYSAFYGYYKDLIC